MYVIQLKTSSKMNRQSEVLDADSEEGFPISRGHVRRGRHRRARGQLPWGYRFSPITKASTQSDQATSSNKLESCNRVSESVDTATGTISLLLADPYLLDCPICANPLHNLIYQCGNGHIACSSCCIEVNRQCPSCSEQITFNRCRAMEKIIESIRVECQNKRYGCNATLLYPKKVEHEKICANMPCYCPIPSCGFVNSCTNLYLHFSSDHKSFAVLFTYNTPFSFGVENSKKYVIVQERNECVIFVLKHSLNKFGRAFGIDCIGSPSSERAYTFDLRVNCLDTSLSLESVPEVHAKWDHGTPSKSFLIIPLGNLEKCGKASVQLCIRKV